MATEKYSNAPQTTMNDSGGISSGDTSVVVTSATGFPTSGNFRILIDSEIMLVTAVSSNTFTITRAQEGTLAVSHVDGSIVTQVLTTGSLSQILSDAVTRAAYSSKPTNERAGKLFIPTDGYLAEYDDGSTWRPFGFASKFTPVIDSDYSWVNQGDATVTASKNVIVLRDDGDSGRNSRLRVKTTPSTPYTITMCFQPMLWPGVQYPSCGMCFYETSSGKMVTMQLLSNNGVLTLGFYKQTNVTTFSAQYEERIFPCMGSPYWFRFKDDGTNRSSWWSWDGINFEQFYSGSRTDFLTADKVGFFVDSLLSSKPATITVYSWEETA